ncbi:hypothetical protein CAP39_06990 [Sphingomonas sp. IBVSS1]|nr:hypothetical protein CAP39_06990 [Sphingomonas sp. IBVSS1]
MKALVGCLRDERRIETLFSLAIIAAIINAILFTWDNGYLPPPFFYEPGDVYGDWFNTAFWARSEGAYDTWTTLYPPLTFVFLRLVGIDRCYPKFRDYDTSAGYAARDCDWLGIVMIWALLAINIVLTYRALKKIDPKTAPLRTCCAGFGWPMLDAVERGNLLLVAYTCFLLAVTPLLSSTRTRAVFAAMAINFKIYLISAFLPLVLKRQWFRVELIVLSTIFVYMLSYVIHGYGTPFEIVRNLTNWSNAVASQILDLWPATSYQPLIAFLQSDNLPLALFIDSFTLNLVLSGLTALLLATQALVVLSAISVALRPEAVPSWRLINLGVLLAIITTETGGYTPAYFLLLIMMEPWKGVLRKTLICLGYVLAIPYDIPLASVLPVVRDTYIGGTTTIISYSITLAPLIRPGLIILVAIILSLLTLIEVWQAVQRHGIGPRPLRWNQA